MISRKLIKKLGFKLLGNEKGILGLITEVWFHDCDIWVYYYDTPDPKLCVGFDASTGRLKEFSIWFVAKVHIKTCKSISKLSKSLSKLPKSRSKLPKPISELPKSISKLPKPNKIHKNSKLTFDEFEYFMQYFSEPKQ